MAPASASREKVRDRGDPIPRAAAPASSVAMLISARAAPSNVVVRLVSGHYKQPLFERCVEADQRVRRLLENCGGAGQRAP